MDNGSLIIGIDLGTTNSVCAYMGEEGPQLIPNALGQVLTPSVVAVDLGGEILVGAAAREMQVLHPERAAGLFKRRMGTDYRFQLAGKEFTPEQLSSLVLRALKEDAEAHLGHPVERAVITVPAYFNDDQRKATIQAGRMAGLKVERIINEPTAAAIAYGLHEAGGEKVIVVFDLGGGTFDVSVVELFEGAVEVRASSGECFLGGEDFTRALAARVLEQVGELYERAEMQAPLLISRLLQLCERAKVQLTRSERVTISVPDREGNVADDAREVIVSREQFQKWTEHVLAGIELPIRRGLGDAKFKRADIDEIILVGGATRMPAVAARITDIFQKTPHSRLNPDEVVALGAAVQAGLIAREKSLDDLVVTDVCPFTLGVEISKKLGMEMRDGYFMPVINRNTTIPCSRVERVTTLHGNQTEIRVKVFQGESRRVKENLMLGEFLVKGIPRGPAGQEIDLRFTYDLNGVLEVEATIVETQKSTSIVITRHVRPGFSEEQIAQAVEHMQTLKSHPREEAVNRFLIKRAERVYRELPLMEREMLMELIDGFEEALSLQDEDAIVRHRGRLEDVLDRFEEGYYDDLDIDDDDDEDESWRGGG